MRRLAPIAASETPEAGLGSAAAARFLGVARGTLAVWRARGKGPPVHFSAAKPVYYYGELRDWQIECGERRHERLEARRRERAEKTGIAK